VLVIASQKPGVLARYGLSREEADRAAWTIDKGGGRREGAAAINRVLRELGGAWPAAASVNRIQPVGALEEVVYRWFANNRERFRRFGVRPECEEPGADCE
jgi:predicted DCC family thiol-disulfide oxidoreductase YuxK